MGKSQYKIQFGGLSMGEHQFEFEIKNKFFEQFSESEITEADIQVKAKLVKQNTLMQKRNPQGRHKARVITMRFLRSPTRIKRQPLGRLTRIRRH